MFTFLQGRPRLSDQAPQTQGHRPYPPPNVSEAAAPQTISQGITFQTLEGGVVEAGALGPISLIVA